MGGVRNGTFPYFNIIILEDWRCDQHRWINQGVRKIPRKDPVLKKSYFQMLTNKGPSADFSRHSYELMDKADSVVLVHYLGNERAAEEFSHGNSKLNERVHVRTCPSVLRRLDDKCKTDTTAKVYKSEITQVPPASHVSVLCPRNSKQVENIRFKQMQKRRISHDALYNMHELALDLPGFIHLIHTHPDLVCVLGQKALLDQLDRVLVLDSTCSQLLSYDTTFQLGDFYVSILCFRHTLFKEAPIIPACFLLHERKFEAHHKELFAVCKKLVPSLSRTTYPIVTDEERAIVNAISDIFPNIPQLRCWNHIFRNITRWLRTHGAKSIDISIYMDDIRTLFHLPTENEYNKSLANMKNKWSSPFFDYYQNNINPDIHVIARWAIEPYGIYHPFSGITNNQSESLNFVVKQLQEWHESPLDCMLLSLYHLQSYYMMEICRGQHGLGNYHLHHQYQNLAPQPIPNLTVYSPEDIVQQVKGKHRDIPEASFSAMKQPNMLNRQLSQRERAHCLIQDKRISYDSGLHTFTVLGSENKPQAVKLFPNPTCTCPSTSQCYHIIAAKMYLGMEITVKHTKFNLTQLRKNARTRKEKKSGRKFPRVGDCEVNPAPDANTVTGIGKHACIEQDCRHLF